MKSNLQVAGGISCSYWGLHVERIYPYHCAMAYCHVVAEGNAGDAGPDAFLMEALFRNEVWGHMQVPVSRVNEEAVCQSMIDGCR